MQTQSQAFNIDCMELMKQYPDKYFDLAVVDPPYKDDFKIIANGKCAKVKKHYNLDSLNNSSPRDNYFDELLRISKNQIIFGINYFPYYFGCGRIIWHKDNTGVYSDCELAYQSLSNTTRIFKYRWNGMLQQNMKNKEIRIHPTQKPIALYDWIFKNYAKPNDKIIDTHLGSGSSRIAAYKNKLQFIGCEIDKDYFDAQEKRFKNFISQTTLF